MGGNNENARPGDESGRAQAPQLEKLARDTNLGSNDAEGAASSTPSFVDQVGPIIDVGLTLIPVNGKAPQDPRWQLREYDSTREAAAAEGRHNLGVRIPRNLLVVDVDPRNGGDESFARLTADCAVDLSGYPSVRTGGGGVHVYLWLPDGFEAVQRHERYPGIDFKTSGQVVAPGSVHPGTGQRYVSERMELLALEIPAPEALLSVVKRRERPKPADGGASRAGELTPAMLAANLEQLDPDDFGQGQHDTWLELMMACHHATDGAGRDEFIEWSTSAAGYGDHADVIGKRWDSLRAGEGGVTVATLFKRVLDAGGAPADRVDAVDDFDAVEMEERPSKPDARWRFLTMEELEALPPPRWIVPGLFVEEGIAAIYGAPESGKSFLAVDVAMSVASGIAWHGREVSQGATLYVAAEGAPGIGKRTRAWRIDRNSAARAVPFTLMRDPLNLTTEKEARDFARSVSSALGPLRLIVIDTLNQTAAGADENSAKEMGSYIAGMKRLRDSTGAAVVVVHHSGKDESKGMRGSTALLGAMDTTVEVVRSTDGGSIEVRVRKQKDAEREPPMRFNLEKVADSLVLRATVMADAASDFAGDPIRAMAREMAKGGRVALKDLVEALVSRDGVSDRTARRRIEAAIPEGRDSASASNGALVWRERTDGNSRGEVIVMVEEVPGCREP